MVSRRSLHRRARKRMPSPRANLKDNPLASQPDNQQDNQPVSKPRNLPDNPQDSRPRSRHRSPRDSRLPRLLHRRSSRRWRARSMRSISS